MTNERFAELRLASALGYHLPGATLEVLTTTGQRRLVADVSNPLSDLHPGELRDLVGHAMEIDSSNDLLRALEITEPGRMSVRLVAAPPMLADLGGGLYSVMTAAGRGTLLFATLLDPHAAHAAIQSASTASGFVPPVNAVLTADDVLRVTVVGFPWHRDQPADVRSGLVDFVQGALAACTVAEQFSVTPA